MFIVYASSTQPINPSPKAQRVLTVPEIWKGLLLKCRKPQLFVTEMSDCEVLEENEKGLKRVVTFKEGMGSPAGKTPEDIVYFEPMKAEFHMPATGTKIANIVSPGASGDPADLYLTFTFEWPQPDVKPGTKEAEDKSKQMQALGTKSVKHTIEVMRGMAEKGDL
ncbi:MAG: hypothetical protein M1830_004595 [Pleopsidium flavum]|nr:MAG: hypothetical protein M1830_004595 [Pleopsidium flavum]